MVALNTDTGNIHIKDRCIGRKINMSKMGKVDRSPSAGNNAFIDNDDGASNNVDISTKEGFERYRDNLLSRIPEDVKSRFREGGFSKWGRDWLPVLVLGPFDVPPGKVRDMWLNMFEKVSCWTAIGL